MRNNDLKELEDFIKQVGGKNLLNSINEDIDLLDYEKALKNFYWSLPVQDKIITKKLTSF